MIFPGPWTTRIGVGVAVGSDVAVGSGVRVLVAVGKGVNVAVGVGVIVEVGVSVIKRAITSGVEQPVKRKKTIQAAKTGFIKFPFN